MTESQAMNNTQHTVLATISLVPLKGEEDDFETLSIIETVRMEVLDTISTFDEYTVQMGSSQTRDAGLLLLVGEIVREAITQKDLVVALFQAGTTAISCVAKKGHVKKIEMTVDGDSISIEDADKLTVQRLIDIYETKHPGKTAALSSSTTVHVIAMVSNVELPTHS